jgi:hypothetical protein
MGRKGKGPIKLNPRMIRKQPETVTAFGGFLSEIMPQIGAEPPIKEKNIIFRIKLLIFFINLTKSYKKLKKFHQHAFGNNF